ncbi:helix-turn-helix domain-containing protein [Halanaerobacter jeridensis]|uniref:Transcriptional regulator with XRE-family HTH domain n=1 Tax=Halanaerobacter jeridensis TaxID=706427 RepID=A0A938XSS1_9FIRM|nr:helix-turn-helix transcriptional regulator [Halanaerobacter jeridensis]MBM7556833.1 transcriptional regulator with XRE-family HTH domain [Halanaerobacter jeridensis]
MGNKEVTIISERMKELRNDKELTQKDLKNELREKKGLKITQQSISFYEAGKRKPKYDLVYHLADYYEVSADYILGRTEYKHQPHIGLIKKFWDDLVKPALVDTILPEKFKVEYNSRLKQVKELLEQLSIEYKNADTLTGVFNRLDKSDQQKIARYYIYNVNIADKELEIFYRITSTEGKEETKRIDISNEGTNYSLPKKPIDIYPNAKVPIVKKLKQDEKLWVKSNIKGHRVTDPKGIEKFNECFYLEVKTDTLTGNRIKIGDRLLIEKVSTINSDDKCIINYNDQYFLANVVEAGEELFLQPVKGQSSKLISQENAIIIGKVVRAEFDL